MKKILDPKDRILDVMASWENPPLIEEVKMDKKKLRTLLPLNTKIKTKISKKRQSNSAIFSTKPN